MVSEDSVDGAATGPGRRRFLILAGGAIATGVVGCAGQAAETLEPAIEFARSTHGEGNKLGDRILVAYASEKGSTGGVADAIGKQLAEGGATVDVRLIGEVTDLASYKAVVVGSATHGGKWLPEAIAFLESNSDKLRRMPVAIFGVCITAAQGKPNQARDLAGWLDVPRQMTNPVAESIFAGALWLKDFPGFGGKLSMRFLLLVLGISEGDHRDWNVIRAWADTTRPLLLR
jgi:menaquinone-dependent protoporphyrinogen oxidase